MKRAWLLVLLFVGVAAVARVIPWPSPPWPGFPWPETQGTAGPGPTYVYWYATGASTFAATLDTGWPGDSGNYLNPLRTPSTPGAIDQGWWNTIRAFIIPPTLIMPDRNNSHSGDSVCHMLNPYCCVDGGGLGLGRVESCPSDDAAGDAICNGFNAGATCERSTIYYLENPVDTPWEDPTYEGINTIPATVVTFAPGINECRAANTDWNDIITATTDLIDGFIASSPNLTTINLHMGISWHNVLAGGDPDCANLWDLSCAPASGFGGTDCSNTFNDLLASYPGVLAITDAAYTSTTGNSMSGVTPLRELYTVSDQLHENIFGWQLITIPDLLANIGFTVTDTPPPAPDPAVVAGPTADAVTLNLAGPIVDADGDDLTCFMWAVPDADWAGGYRTFDRVHNGFGMCRHLNGGVACPNCGNAANDADCDVAGTFDDQDADFWLTPTDAPEVNDCSALGARCMPDFFEIPCDDSASRVIHGLAPNTTYRVHAIAWPTLVPGHVDQGILPSAIDDTLTFTTLP